MERKPRLTGRPPVPQYCLNSQSKEMAWPLRPWPPPSGRSACPLLCPSWPPAAGTWWWSAAATTASPRPPTWPGPAAPLVLERRERLGGACTLEQPFADPGYLVSPWAYVVGLLDQTVVDELSLERYGYRVFVADPNLWVPF